MSIRVEIEGLERARERLYRWLSHLDVLTYNIGRLIEAGLIDAGYEDTQFSLVSDVEGVILLNIETYWQEYLRTLPPQERTRAIYVAGRCPEFKFKLVYYRRLSEQEYGRQYREVERSVSETIRRMIESGILSKQAINILRELMK